LNRYYYKKVFALLLSVFCTVGLLSPFGVSADTNDSINSYKVYQSNINVTSTSVEEIVVPVGNNIETSPIKLVANINKEGLYTIGMRYKGLDDGIENIEIGLAIDGKIPFSEASKLYFPRMWTDDENKRVDGIGNEFAPKQLQYDELYTNFAKDVTRKTSELYTVYLTKGAHEIEITPVSGKFYLDSFIFGVPTTLTPYNQLSLSGYDYKGKPIIIECEKAKLKNKYSLTPLYDNSSIEITPNDVSKNVLNYIGGANWSESGDTIIWETPELKAGFYQLGFSYRQSTVIGGNAYRRLTIDGKVPFEEADSIGFNYDDNWQTEFYKDEEGKPYKIYLSEGKHEIALEVVPGDIKRVSDFLTKAVEEISSLYIDMTMITGETVDTYRDYDLFSQIKDMDKRLKHIGNLLYNADHLLKKLTGLDSGSHSSIIKNMMRTTQLMLENRYIAHRYITDYYTSYTALASALNEMQKIPLELDKISLSAVNEEEPFAETSFWEEIWFSIKRFFISFIRDYNGISGDSSEETVVVWVNFGRDQAQILNSMALGDFYQETGIPVDIKLVNASIVQAVLSGEGPDCILQHSRSEPVNLAMRGVLYDLENFDDLDDVLKRFRPNAETPYRYKDGLYALPDTQTFYLLYYRKDILEKFGIDVPKTWDDFKEAANLLARNNLNVWIPNNPATSVGETNLGIGSINLFPTFLLQNNLNVYTDDGRKTNLSDSSVVTVFSEWTEYYTKLKLPKSIDFYNRFRTGTCPLGVGAHTLYTQFKAAAPEIDGLWGVAPIPGTVMPDGSFSNVSTGGGSACAILSGSSNPQNAWKFIKWWTDEKTQLTYSNEIEAILGPTGRVAVSNVSAFERMSWDAEMRKSIMEASANVKEIPEYPGSYYVSRSVYHSFWRVINSNANPKDTLIKYAKQADAEIIRKWNQYDNRGKN